MSVRLPQVPKRVAALLAATAVLAGGVTYAVHDPGHDTEVNAVKVSTVRAASAEDCQMHDAHPDSGTLKISYVKDSSDQDPNFRDYRLVGSLRWDNQHDLDCFAKGVFDDGWGYEY